MESSVDNLVCLLCCDPVPQAAHRAHGLVIITALHKFISSSDLCDKSDPISVEQLLLPPGGVSLCGPCLAEVRHATDAGERVEEYEEIVRHLQQQLLRMMEELRELMNAYLGRMTALQEKISKKQEIPQQNESARRFRENVLRVTRNLKSFRREVVDNSHVTAEEFPVAHTPDSPEEAAVDDAPVSPPPEFPPADDGDNASDPDFNPVSSPPPSHQKKKRRRPRPTRKKSPAVPKNIPSLPQKNRKRMGRPLVYPPGQKPERQLPQCTICGVIMRGPVKQHEMTHLSQEERAELMVPCEFCGRRLMRVYMSDHKRRYCPVRKAPVEPVPCPDCGKTFSNPRQLREHCRRKHEHVQVDKMWSCELCGKQWKFRKDLRTHQAHHHPEIQAEMPYKCGGCGKGFRWLKNLNEHQPKCKARVSQ